MTAIKPRHPVSVAGACTQILGRLGDAAAVAVNKSDSLIRKWADPDHDSEPTFSQMLDLDAAYVAATGESAPLKRAYVTLLRERTAAVAHQAQAPQSRLLDVMAEIGEISAAAHRAMDDGTMTANEAAPLQRDIGEAIEKLTQMSRDVDALCRKGGAA